MTRPKHIPQRTCVGCRTTSSKRQFVRIVRTPGGTVEVDPTGKRNGRGAYLCEHWDCWEAALKKDRLARALHTTIPVIQREALLSFGERFCEPAVGVAG